ncbi:glyoxalase [Rhodocytophaga rosea]|uniref:Glyoxalase n=1 Tax=Rhodocytophaga rosea TaxID=2704465 RepID=A0A6C0GMJ5_9BACT|nr:VOC family protein [Rhodocytophaga rosea]QHT68850.1 glyoxalase [Rhodocytophaga rosea]
MRQFIIFLMLIFSSVVTFGQDKLGFAGHNHVGLHVADIGKSTAFYRDIIGLRPIPVPDDLKAIRSWFDIGNGQQIHLLAGRTEKIYHDRNGGHIAFFVESITQAETFLTKYKIQFHKQTRFDKVVQIYFSDPDGYLIEINERK